MSAPLRPRVLFVDDDASIRRFVELALEDLPIELQLAGSVAQALQLLRDQGPVALLLTDLMMPGESGLDLLRTLQQQPALTGDARIVVLSAGLHPSMRAELAAAGAWRMLAKPVAVGELLRCVSEGVATDAVESAPATAHQAPSVRAFSAPEEAALATYFGGQRELYAAFREQCLAQFGRDVLQGQAAITARDAPALRRLAHSLKSVLASLGHEPASAIARQLENASMQGDWVTCDGLWPTLCVALQRLQGAD